MGKTLARDFGDIDTAGKISPGAPDFLATSLRIVEASGKVQMAPARQPKDAFVFSSFTRRDFEGENLYNVILYFDAIH